MKVVLDTNVLVSGLLNPYGPCGEIVRMLAIEELIIYIDARILSEYREVLNRKKFKFNKEQINIFIELIEQNGQFVSSIPTNKNLPDPDDKPFIEVAISGKVEALVTGNLKHFPINQADTYRIFSPSEFLEYFKEKTY